MNQKEWINSLKILLKQFGIDNPKSLAIYQEALTHKSYAHENRLKVNQQRLEFLGDAAIGWIISNYLFKLDGKKNEGDMTVIKSKLVNSEALAFMARKINLTDLIYLGKGVNREDLSNKILEDTFEAFVGAITQDQGIKKAVRLINQTLIDYYESNDVVPIKDSKTLFQEYVQSTNGHQPNSIVYKHSTKDGGKISELYYCGSLYGTGIANNYKTADQEAAREALSKCQIAKVEE